MEWDLKVKIDYREHLIKKFFENHEELKNIIEIKNLEIGDIIIEINQKPLILIERKTIPDLASSISDGRLREQKHRISLSNFNNSQIIYLIEGNIEQKLYGGINKKSIQGSIINTLVRDNYKVYKTYDIEETKYFLERLFMKILKDKDKLINLDSNISLKSNGESEQNGDYSKLANLSKKNQLTPDVFNKIILLQIPGISSNHINEIKKNYSSIKDLILKYNSIEKLEDRHILLENIIIELKNNKKRKLGKVLSKRIYEYLYL